VLSTEIGATPVTDCTPPSIALSSFLSNLPIASFTESVAAIADVLAGLVYPVKSTSPPSIVTEATTSPVAGVLLCTPLTLITSTLVLSKSLRAAATTASFTLIAFSTLAKAWFVVSVAAIVTVSCAFPVGVSAV
jgi:hypothetical protein